MLKPSLACLSEAAGARNLSAYFPFYIPIPNLVFFFTFGPRILGKRGKAESNKKAIQPKWINIKKKKKKKNHFGKLLDSHCIALLRNMNMEPA